MMKKMNYLTIMIVLIVSVLSGGSSTVIVAAHGTKHDSFCLRSRSSNTCPNPPTVDNLNLTAYLGRWYEIGSTASFKLLSEAGLRCNQAVYSSVSGTVRLLNSGQKVISTAAIVEVGAINVATRGICSLLRQVCADVANSANASHSLGKAAASAGLALSQLSDDITDIQLLNGKINQADYPTNSKYGLVWSVAALKKEAQSASSRLKKIDEFAAELMSSGQAVTAVRIKAATAAVSTALAAIHASATALLANGQPILGSVSFVNGTITQPNPATSAGKLLVSIGPVAAPYWIIDLVNTGTDSHPSYSAALVYSCSQFAGVVSKSLFILSRSPKLEGLIVSRFLNKAQSLGIYNDCNDPFLFTVQQGGNCGRVA